MSYNCDAAAEGISVRHGVCVLFKEEGIDFMLLSYMCYNTHHALNL